MKVDLKEKIVVVTGASRGIGKATAEAFAKEGAHVAAIGRDEAALADVVNACRGHGVRAEAFACDLGSEQAVNDTVAKITASLGPIDVLVNNAGVGRYAPFVDLELADWQNMLDVNVLGVVRMMKAVLPGMIERKSGDIINISSIQGLETGPRASAYSASKFAVVGLTEAVGKEVVEHGVRVAVLCPGGVLTDFAGIPSDRKTEAFLDVGDVADAVITMAQTKGKAWLRKVVLAPFMS